MRECNELIEKKIFQSGAKICYLATSKKVEFKENNYNTWLGAASYDDAKEVVDYIVDNSLDKPRIITDCYGIDADWLGICRPYCSTVMCVDDLVNRFLDCDILVDPTFKRGEVEYKNLVPDRTILLCGSRYMPLSESLANCGEKPLQKQDEVNILVSFGATDPNDFSIRLMKCLKIEDVPVNYFFKILLTSDYEKSTELFNLVQELRAINRSVQLIFDTKDIAMEYAWADICIGAAGQSIYERIFSKLHSIVVKTEENQTANYTRLKQHPFVHLFPESSEFIYIFDFLRNVLRKKEILQVENELLTADFDLHGAQRIADVFIKGAEGAAF